MSKKLYAIRLEEKTMNEIKKIADKKKRTTSNLLRMVIENYVEEYQ